MATQQTEALSFVARLPAPSPALTERLEKWGAKECDRFSIQPQGEEVIVFITRKTPTTALKLQRNIRTMASHWQVPLATARERLVGSTERRGARGPRS